MSDESDPRVGTRGTDGGVGTRGTNRGIVNPKVQEAATGIKDFTLPWRDLKRPEVARELYQPPAAQRSVPAGDIERYALLPPFFDSTWAARQARVKAALDAVDQWTADTGDWAVVSEATFGLVGVPNRFDRWYELIPDYVDQFYLTLEHIYQHPLWMRAGVAGGAKGLARMLAQLFPGLVTIGRQAAGLYRFGAAGGTGGHHIFAKAGFPKAVGNRMFAISQEALAALKWNHDAMTQMQRFLYRQLVKQGGSHTMKDHMHIAYAALRAGGANHEQARWLVAQALRNLRRAGIRAPTHLPKFGR